MQEVKLLPMENTANGCVALPWHFKFYICITNVKILKCKIFLINFLNELGNFKQKHFYTSKCKNFLHLKATDPLSVSADMKKKLIDCTLILSIVLNSI